MVISTAMPPYSPKADGLVCCNGSRYYNRPLYGANRASVLLAGDRPCLRFVDTPMIGGTMLLAMARGDQSKWLHDWSHIHADYRANALWWTLTDDAFPGAVLQLAAVPHAQGAGFSVHLTGMGLQPSDAIIWTFGGMQQRDAMVLWEVDPSCHPEGTTSVFSSLDCVGNAIHLAPDTAALSVSLASDFHLRGMVPVGTALVIADARRWRVPLQLVPTRGKKRPLVCGTTVWTDKQQPLIWSFTTTNPATAAASLSLFEQSIAYWQYLAQRVQIRTPDPHLNALVGPLNIALDAYYYPPMYVHGAMAWNIPFIGWRLLYGPTAFGWHERVKDEATEVLASQIEESPYTTAQPDPALGLSLQAPQSRYYGRGRLTVGTAFYNMQEVFFDQLIHAWRWTNDPVLEARLRPALERHLAWQRECFDPDDDGVYESYLNIWASDSIWYNGGGTPHATAYAYYAYRAAAEMARRAGDDQVATLHEERLRGIEQGVRASLWIEDAGHFGEYREAQGLRRRHDDASLHTVIHPIDAQLVTPFEAAQMLDYSERQLERVQVHGGELCATSNFVPYEWSVRELDFADTLHLALAYYQSGLGQNGWSLLQGVLHEAGYWSVVPGSFVLGPLGQWQRQGTSQDNHGTHATDFADTVSMFGRALIEGLFGYRPNYPQGRVVVAPQFPPNWEQASVTTPDFTLHFSRETGVDHYVMTLQRAAAIEFLAKIPGESVDQVSVNGAPSAWDVLTNFDSPRIRVTIPPQEQIMLDVCWMLPLSEAESLTIQVKQGTLFRLSVSHGTIQALHDPQQVCEHPHYQAQSFQASVRGGVGWHTIFLQILHGNLSYWQRVAINVHPVTEDRPALQPAPSARWQCYPLTPFTNGDIRAIYQQTYVSPRPPTCSAQIGTDGYSPWPFPFWQRSAPLIATTEAESRLDREGRFWTDGGVPFLWPKGEYNAVLTSQWDNWPTVATVPLKGSGNVLWLLVAGTLSHMQTMIAVGEFRVHYADARIEQVPLIHPTTLWSISGHYDTQFDAFALPLPHPQEVQLGANCRAVLLRHPLRPGQPLRHLTLETFSLETIIALLGVTLMQSP